MSRIEQIINEIEEYIANCKQVPLSNTKIYVVRDELEELVNELRLKTPDEIKKYQKIISNKEAILTDAKEQAESIINAAKIHTEELINEHEIMQKAYEQANEVITNASLQAQDIVDKATEDANNIRLGAIRYTDDMLANLQIIIEHSIENSRIKYDALLNSLNKDLNIVMSNRNELRPQPESDSDEESDTDDNKAEQDKESDED